VQVPALRTHRLPVQHHRLGNLVEPKHKLVITNQRLVKATCSSLPELPKANVIGEPCRRRCRRPTDASAIRDGSGCDVVEDVASTGARVRRGRVTCAL
jgi:hypothetical protein